MEWRWLENDWQKLYLTSLLHVSSHSLSATNIIGREAEEYNCSEQRWDDVYNVSADRGVSDMTIIATIVTCQQITIQFDETAFAITTYWLGRVGIEQTVTH